MLSAKQKDLLEGTLANDEFSTDEELLEFFVAEGVDEGTAKRAIEQRPMFLREPVYFLNVDLI